MGVSGWEGETFTMNTMNIVDPDEGGAGKILNTEQTQALSLAPYANNIDGRVCVCP